MIRKILAACALLFAFSIPAVAAPTGDTGFYFGADAVYDGLSLKSGVVAKTPNALYGVNLYGGHELLQGVAVEVGYTGVYSSASLASATEQGVHADVVLRVPLTDSLDLKALGGVNYVASAAHVIDFNAFATYRSFNWGWHIAAGPELTIASDLGLRVLAGYQQGGFGPAGNGDLTVSAGLAWHV